MKIIHYIFFITIFMSFHHDIVAVNDTTQSFIQEKIEQLQQQKDELEIQLNENLTDEQQQNILQEIIVLEHEIHTQKLLLKSEKKITKIAIPVWKKIGLVIITGLSFTFLTILWLTILTQKTKPVQPNNKSKWTFTSPSGHTTQLTQKPDFDTSVPGTYTAIRERDLMKKNCIIIEADLPWSRGRAKNCFKDFS